MLKRHCPSPLLTVLWLMTLLTGFASCTTPEEKIAATVQETDSLIASLQDENADARYAAAQDARMIGPPAIRPVSVLLASTDPGPALSAQQALWSIVHHSCRPDAKRERRACSNNLLSLLTDKATVVELPLKARHEILRMLSVSVDDGRSVRTLDKLLDDPELADMALFALERIDNATADEVLTQRLARKPALPLSAVAAAVGQRRIEGAVSSLVALSETDDADDAAAALHALALIASDRDEADKALRAAFVNQAPDSVDNLLVYADGRLAAGDDEKAVEIFTLFTRYREAHVRAAAVRGLGRAGGDEHFELFIELLADEAAAVRAEAQGAIVSTKDDIASQLDAAYAEAAPLARAALLRIMVDRGEAAAVQRVKDALADEASPVRMEALDLAGGFEGTGFEPLLLAAAARAEGAEKDRAFASYLELAEKRLAGGDRIGAIAMFHTVSDQATALPILTGALDGIAAVGDRASLERVEKLAADSGLREPVGRARLAIATSIKDKDSQKSRELLELVCFESGSRTLRTSALAVLREMGIDTTGYARRQGFVPDWLLIGPFPKATKEDLGTHPFEGVFPLPDKPVTSGDKELFWKAVTTDDMDGMVDLLFIKPSQNVCAYGHGTFWHPTGGDGMIKLGSDDGVALWLNGELVHENFASRGASVDQDRFKVTYRAGFNKVLIKVTQGGGDWRFCVRIADADGGPIDLSKKR